MRETFEGGQCKEGKLMFWMKAGEGGENPDETGRSFGDLTPTGLPLATVLARYSFYDFPPNSKTQHNYFCWVDIYHKHFGVKSFFIHEYVLKDVCLSGSYMTTDLG